MLIAELVKSDRFTIQRLTQISNGRNIQLGQSVGTQIATAPTQKMGFYGATPIIQQTVGTVANGSTASDGVARAGLNSLITALIALGIIA